jgi:hypothetical protein
MATKRVQYYDLDEIGAIGVIKERSAAEMRRDAEEMFAVIRAYKLGQASITNKSVPTSKKFNKPAGKVAQGSTRISKAHPPISTK